MSDTDTHMEPMMRTKEELEEAYKKIGELLENPKYEDDESLQVIYETIKWFDGYDWSNTVEPHLPLD